MQVLFWVALAFVAYTYAGYPLAVWVWSRLSRPLVQPAPQPAEWPEVTVVIAGYNEVSRIERKIQNLRALDYPAGKLRIVFVSDGSTDGTETSLKQFAEVQVLSYPDRRGKPHALNCAMQVVKTPVVVFADVRQQIEPKAVRRLVARLLQPGVGAVSGELVHFDPQTQAAANIGLYWRYEKWIRGCESRVASTVGVTGALYAMRSPDYSPLPPDTLLDDFEQPMRLVRRGLRVLFEPGAVILDELQQDVSGERKRKIRTLTGNFQAFFRNPWLFVPWQNPVFIQFLSHKFFRLLVPYALPVIFIGAWLSDGWVYQLFAGLQLAGYLACLASIRLPALRRNRVVSFGLVFIELNWAAVLALRNYLGGQTDARWEKT